MIFKSFTFTAITIERDIPHSTVECGNCTKCCELLSPILTPEEFVSGKYVYTLLQSDNPDLPYIAIPKLDTGCFYFKDGKCSIYETRPNACRQFDCRKGHYPLLKDIALEKFGQYSDEPEL